MLHSIGSKPNEGDRTLLGRLLDCHARIREMLALATSLAQRGSAEDEEVQATAERLSRYFTRALPMHTKDEDESIAPRLMSREASAAIERMGREHREHETLIASLVTACATLADAPSRWQELSQQVGLVVVALEPAMLMHLEEEERDVFPLLAALDDATCRRIVDEMEGRREADGGGGRGSGRRGGGGGGGGRQR